MFVRRTQKQPRTRIYALVTAVLVASTQPGCLGSDPTAEPNLRIRYSPAESARDDYTSTQISLTHQDFLPEIRTAAGTSGSEHYSGLEPGTWHVAVVGGLTGNDNDLGVVFVAATTEVTISRKSPVDVVLTLKPCRIEDHERCDPTFGQRRSDPDPPIPFPIPNRSSCEELHVAGVRPPGTDLRKQSGELIENPDGTRWTWDLGTEIAGQIDATVSRSIRTAWSDSPDITSGLIAVSTFIDPDALCFNPYKITFGDLDATGIGTDVQLRWRARKRIGEVQLLMSDPSGDLAASYDEAALQMAIDDSMTNGYGAFQTQATAQTITFPRPATTTWLAALYVTNPTGIWTLEGAFQFDQKWLELFSHPSLP